MSEPLPFEVPFEILEKAREVQHWFIKNGITSWAICDICSRDHAFQIDKIRQILKSNSDL